MIKFEKEWSRMEEDRKKHNEFINQTKGCLAISLFITLFMGLFMCGLFYSIVI